MKTSQDRITDTPLLSTQNCKLRANTEILDVDQANLSETHQISIHHPVYSHKNLQQHLFNQIPRIQNSLHCMGVRMRGLSMLQA